LARFGCRSRLGRRRGWRDRRAFSLVETPIVHALEVDGRTFHLKHDRDPTTLIEARPVLPQDPWSRPYVYTDLSQICSRGRARKDEAIRARDGAFLGLASDV
jgi:hypothetical protein